MRVRVRRTIAGTLEGGVAGKEGVVDIKFHGRLEKEDPLGVLEGVDTLDDLARLLMEQEVTFTEEGRRVILTVV